MVVKDIERDDIDQISRSLGCKPVADSDTFTADKLGAAELVEEKRVGTQKVVRLTGVKNPGLTCSIVVRGSNELVLDETDRSLHDALCVVRALVKRKAMIVGGGSPEIEVSRRLMEFASTLHSSSRGTNAYCVRAFAEALEVIPYTLAENAGLHPIAIVTELRKRHADGESTCGINVKKGIISDMEAENVLQPVLVNISSIKLATETVRMMLKIDAIQPVA